MGLLRIALAAVVLLLLVFAFFRLHAIRNEKERFSRLIREKSAIPLAVEVLAIPALAAAIYALVYLVGQAVGFLPEGASRIVLVILVSLAGTLVVRNLPLIKSRIVSGIPAVLFYVVLVLYGYYTHLHYGFIGFEETGRQIFVPVSNTVYPWMKITAVALTIIQFRISPIRALIIVLVNIPLWFVSAESGYPAMTWFFMLAMLSNLAFSSRTTAKVLLGAFCSIWGIIAVGFTCGWVGDRQVVFDYGGPAHSLGMGHPNLAALIILSMLLLIWYLWLQEHLMITFMVFFAVAIGLYPVLYSRTGSICLALFPLLALYRKWMIKKGSSRGMAVMAWVPLLAACGSIALGLLASTLAKAGLSGGTLFLRFSTPNAVIREYGVSLFGFGELNRATIILDNLFWHTGIFYGMTSLTVVMGILIWTGWVFYRRKQYGELLILTLFMIYSIMETAMIYMPYGYILLLAEKTEISS